MVEAAIALADANGLEAVTMRAVAERLGVSPMTLYTYVPGKAELLDLMLDALWLAMPRRKPADWPAVRRRRTPNRALYDSPSLGGSRDDGATTARARPDGQVRARAHRVRRASG